MTFHSTLVATSFCHLLAAALESLPLPSVAPSIDRLCRQTSSDLVARLRSPSILASPFHLALRHAARRCRSSPRVRCCRCRSHLDIWWSLHEELRTPGIAASSDRLVSAASPAVAAAVWRLSRPPQHRPLPRSQEERQSHRHMHIHDTRHTRRERHERHHFLAWSMASTPSLRLSDYLCSTTLRFPSSSLVLNSMTSSFTSGRNVTGP